VIFIKPSERVEFIIRILEECKADVRWAKQQLKESEATVTDLKHELIGAGSEKGLHPPKYEDRAKIATKMQNALLTRRAAKDAIQINQPLLKFVESDIGTRAMNQLGQVLGELRNVERNMEERVYGKRGSENLSTNKKLNRLIRDWKKRNRSKY